MTAPLIHPEAVTGEPRAVRWVTDVDLPAGRVVTAPGTLGPLLSYGVIERILVERAGVWMWLAEGHSWAEHGPRLRDALVAALGLGGWEVDESSPEVLRLVATHVLDVELKPYISSHGGAITLHSATSDSLVLDFNGACADCPAAGLTLHLRVERAVRLRYPQLAEVSRRAQPSRAGAWFARASAGGGRSPQP